jgi:DNA-binding MarR family transcriptional regulator
MRVDDSGNVSSPQGAVAVAPGAGVAPSDAQRPFVDTYLAALLAQASELISGEFHRVVRAHGLSVAEWRVLATLSGGHTLTTGKLAQISLNKGPTATRMLDRMESRGQVERLGDTADRRITRVRITPEGQRTVSALIALAREHEARVLQPFGLDQAEALKRTLRGMIEQRRAAGATDESGAARREPTENESPR